MTPQSPPRPRDPLLEKPRRPVVIQPGTDGERVREKRVKVRVNKGAQLPGHIRTDF